MGGRGSGGSRSGGGRGKTFVDVNQYETDNNQFAKTYREKFAQMNDQELERAYTNTRNQMMNESLKYEYERRKLQKLHSEYARVKESDPDFNEKSKAYDKQIEKVQQAQTSAEARTQIHYIALNERNNVRRKQVAGQLSSMTNGQVNSFYNRSYRESTKAKDKVERTKNPKTKEKYQKLYDKHNDNFWAANKERSIRGLDGKDW